MSWKTRANTIDTNDRSHIVLFSHRDVLAISDSSYYENTGRVRMFALNPEDKWIQLGSNIVGEMFRDSGDLSALSLDGTTVATGAYINDANGDVAGNVCVFAHDRENNEWVQRRGNIYEERSKDESGWSVLISGNVYIVVVGASYNDNNRYKSGPTWIFQFSGKSWKQQGSNLDGCK